MIILLCVLCLNKTLCQSYICYPPSLFCSTVPSLQQPYLQTRTKRKNVIFNSHYAIDKFTKEFSWGKLDNFSILSQKNSYFVDVWGSAWSYWLEERNESHWCIFFTFYSAKRRALSTAFPTAFIFFFDYLYTHPAFNSI